MYLQNGDQQTQTPRGNASFSAGSAGSVSGKNKKGPPSAPPMPDSPTLNRALSGSPRFSKGELEEEPTTPGTPNPDALNQARFRLRRTNTKTHD